MDYDYDFEELLDDFKMLLYAISRYNTITERDGVRTYEELALKENYFNALLSLCNKYNVECSIDENKKLSSILIMETEAEHELQRLILDKLNGV